MGTLPGTHGKGAGPNGSWRPVPVLGGGADGHRRRCWAGTAQAIHVLSPQATEGPARAPAVHLPQNVTCNL